MHGGLLALLAVAKRAAPPVMHARSLNPYVDAAMADWRQTHGLIAVVPRVPCTTALWFFLLIYVDPNFRTANSNSIAILTL